MMIKIITGFSEDQKYTVDANEAHKAYYLFMNPEKRAIFSNGLALTGKSITGIQPDWNASMGWNPGYNIQPFDWNDIRGNGVERKLKELMEKGKDIAYLVDKNPELLSKPLEKIDIKLLNA